MLLMDIAQFLNDEGIGVFDVSAPAGNIFVGTYPADPNVIIALFDTGGPADDVNKGFTDVRRTFQVMVRDVTYQGANDLSWSINALLKDYLETNGRKLIIKAMNPPTPIGQDNHLRYEFTSNYFAWTKPN